MSPSGVCLHGSCHETLGEEEGRSPVADHGAVFNPLSEESYPVDKVIDP